MIIFFFFGIHDMIYCFYSDRVLIKDIHSFIHSVINSFHPLLYWKQGSATIEDNRMRGTFFLMAFSLVFMSQPRFQASSSSLPRIGRELSKVILWLVCFLSLYTIPFAWWRRNCPFINGRYRFYDTRKIFVLLWKFFFPKKKNLTACP